MKTLLALLLISCVHFSAHARTQAMFAADGTKATIMLMSMTAGDNDAAGLFKALAVPEEILNGKPTKKFNFDDVQGLRTFSIVCVMSAFVSTLGTCTVILHATPNTLLDEPRANANLKFRDVDNLNKITPLFNISPGNGIIFTTADGHFQIGVAHSDGRLAQFEIQYR